MSEAQTQFHLLLEHILKGHKRTRPWDSEEDLIEMITLDWRTSLTYKDLAESVEVQRDAYSEMDRWHSEHHAEYKDFMLHILSPYSHV